MYSRYNKGKSVVAERCIRTLKTRFLHTWQYHLTHQFFDVLDDIVNKYNNTVHTTIKMKPVDVVGDSYAEYNEDFNEKGPKFKVADHVRISKYKKIFGFAKGYAPNWSEEVFIVNKIKNTVPWTCVVNNLNGAEITGSFH